MHFREREQHKSKGIGKKWREKKERYQASKEAREVDVCHNITATLSKWTTN